MVPDNKTVPVGVCLDGLGPDDDQFKDDPGTFKFVVYPYSPSADPDDILGMVNSGIQKVFDGKNCPSVDTCTAHSMDAIVSSRELTPAELEAAMRLRSESEDSEEEGRVFRYVTPQVFRDV
ncbi:hypothetical protein HOI18_03055 [Candidatus Uhrbacteria bacterium]|jgi:hypothetical protein|nr:hypothetical protein [Candidatus Uhrbacteria bacterium]